MHTPKKTKETVFVGLSGGVDSSVAALRLCKEGYDVVGVFIKTWHPDFITCNEEVDRLDAMRVAAHLDIPFITYDAKDAYRDAVVTALIDGYKKGRTPNPDVICNHAIKFGVFLDFALKNGASMIATGHYAQTKIHNGHTVLLRGKDPTKDQSYFLWMLSQKQLSHVLFPIGDSLKLDIRKEAARAGLPTAIKQDSQGICMLGDIDMQDFLSHYIKIKEGAVQDASGNVIGEHDGAAFYTTGQRHGFRLHVGQEATKPHYVLSKDIKRNIVVVGTKSPVVTTEKILLRDVSMYTPELPPTCTAQFRYRQKPCTVSLVQHKNTLEVQPHGSVELPSAGQSCVLYNDDMCLGGGIIEVTDMHI